MRKEDLNNWTADRLKDEIVNLSDKNFNLEWRINQFEESEERWKCKIESLRTENERLNVDNAAYSSANSMYKEHLEECEQKYRAIYKCRLCGEEFVSAITGNADIAIKQMVRVTTGIKFLEFIGNPIEETSMHSCKGGSMGMADFLGFRKVGE